MPGRYDVPPGATAVDVLRGLLTTSAERLEASGLVGGAQSIGSTPYEVLVIASLVEKEAITPDMPKVARVIYNRLGAGRRLELDSMVNYPLDLQALRTTAEDRARPGPYNSYVVAGLPPTPIAAPGREAIAAALAPEPGPWLYFVRCQTDGTSCFAETFAEHHGERAAGARQRRLLTLLRGSRTQSAGLPKKPGGGSGDGVVDRSEGTGAPRTNRWTSAPASTRAGNASPASRRTSSATGSGMADATRTRLPNRRPCSSCGTASTATSGEHSRGRRHLGAGERERPAVGDIRGVRPVRGERGGHGPHELHRGDVRRGARAGEHVQNHQIDRGGRDGRQRGPRVADGDLDAGAVGR